MKQRILGFDFARGLAIIGMIFVNFKVVMSNQSSGWLYEVMEVFSGKAAALFVVLAGVGMTLMYKSALRKNDVNKLKQVKTDLLKRAVFLFVIGLSYYFIWPADILHFYGLYLTIGVIFLGADRRWLFLISILLIIGYTFMFPAINYEKGWNWTTLEYTDFFTIKGFFRNLFLNGFHPVIPWVAFLLTGIWVGRINFRDTKIRKKVLLVSLAIFILFKGISVVLVNTLSTLSPSDTTEIEYAFGTTPMPPLFFYMVTASSLSVFIITLSIYITEKFSDTLFIKQMVSAGQLALSNYFFHVIIGMLGAKLLFGKLEQAFTIEFTLAYACVFNILSVVFSYFWRKRFERGPLEYVMRKITG
jgi:uncharacterized membrane protein YeiB